MSRAIGLTVANAGNILADVATNEERANYWIDQYYFFKANGRFRGGAPGTGPFERGTNPFEPSPNLDPRQVPIQMPRQGPSQVISQGTSSTNLGSENPSSSNIRSKEMILFLSP